MHDKILIVDFGSQVTQLIARRVREERVYSEIVPFRDAESAFAAMKPKGVILSGGPASVLDRGHHREFGRAEVLVTDDCALFEGVWQKGERYPVWMSHGDRVTELPPGFRVVATSA